MTGSRDVMAGHGLATAQVRIVIAMARSFGAEVVFFFPLAPGPVDPAQTVARVTWNHRVRVQPVARHTVLSNEE